MKILYIGNKDCFGFRICKWLRKRGIESKLLMEDPIFTDRSKPEHYDESFKDNYPKWIKRFMNNSLNYIFPSLQIRREVSQADVILTTGHAVVLSLYFSKPVIFIPIGADFSYMPFWFGRESLRRSMFSLLYNYRLNNLDYLVSNQQDIIWAARLLRMEEKVRRYAFPVDMERIKENIDEVFLGSLYQKYQNYDKVFFNPTRKNLGDKSKTRKGVDKFIKAYKRFTTENKNCNTIAVLGMHGKNVEEYRELVESLDFNDEEIEYINHLSSSKLHAYMSFKKTVVFNSFFDHNREILSGIDREALVLGAPLVSRIRPEHKNFVEVYGTGCPVLSALDEDEILCKMKEITTLPKHRYLALRKSSEEWVKNNLHWENNIGTLIDIIQESIS